MEKATGYLKSSSAVLVSLYVVYAGIVLIMFVVNALTQQELSDWLIKGGLIAAVFIVINFALTGLSLLFSKK